MTIFTVFYVFAAAVFEITAASLSKTKQRAVAEQAVKLVDVWY